MNVFEAWLHLFHPRRSNNHRPHLLHTESLFVLVVLAISAVGILSATTRIWTNVTGTVLGFSTTITAQQVIAQTNVKRQQLGLSGLQLSPTLAAAAHLKAEDMFAHQYWAHVSPQGKEPWDFIRSAGYVYQAAGENLARDFMETDEMVDAWMNSPTHRANIVNARYQEIGIAVVNGSLQGAETTLVVQLFGRPQSEKAQAAITPTADAQETTVTSRTPQVEAVEQHNGSVETTPTETPQPAILSAMSLFSGTIKPWPMVSPLQLLKAFFLSIVVLLVATLGYDWALMHNSTKARIVGKNLAHILFFACIVFLLVTFHSGTIR